MLEMMLVYVVYAFQIILAVILLNVWIMRFSKPTKYRGKGTNDMKEEFRAYGLPEWFMYLVGLSKIVISGLLILGFWVPSVVYPASVFLAALMLGAIAMHIKVKDPIVRSMPAVVVFLMALINIILLRFI